MHSLQQLVCWRHCAFPTSSLRWCWLWFWLWLDIISVASNKKSNPFGLLFIMHAQPCLTLNTEYKHEVFLEYRWFCISLSLHLNERFCLIFYENGSRYFQNERLFHKYHILPSVCTSLQEHLLRFCSDSQNHNKCILAELFVKCKQKNRKDKNITFSFLF